MDQEKRRASNKQVHEAKLPSKPFATEREYAFEEEQEN